MGQPCERCVQVSVIQEPGDGHRIEILRDGKSSVFHWTNAASDVSFGRIPVGTGEFVVTATPTCGSTNGITRSH